MTDPTEQPTPKRFLSHAFIPALGVCVLAAAALLYVTIGSGGKETAEAKACAANAAQRAAVDRAAKGEVAALAIAKESKPVTPLAFGGPDGQPETLDAFRGRVVLLNLWATWCVPCRQEMPALDRLEAKLGGKDFQVVAVNIDTTRLDKPKAFLNEVGVKALSFYSDPKADVFYRLKQAGKVVGLPTTVLIDRNGCEIGTLAGPALWDSPDGMALIEAAVKS
ncbi:MAG TPA: TlpA disulfide reductase family protein [Beijerinckiaceae bacterium]|jgi:thiol-disulfide isomerase/thioredoxin|nr:TlpA disulfide reductase family protein [Beijerinckiaceae bacterium]